MIELDKMLIVARFVLTFLIVFASVYTARRIHSRAAGFIAAFPTITALSLLFIHTDGHALPAAAHGSLLSLLGAIFFLFTYNLMRSFWEQGSRLLVLSISLIIFFGVSFGLTSQTNAFEADLLRFGVFYVLLNGTLLLMPGNWRPPRPKGTLAPISIVALGGAFIVFFATLAAIYINPFWGGAVGSIPATIIPTLLDIDRRDHYLGVSSFIRTTSGLLASTAVFSIVLFYQPIADNILANFALAFVGSLVGSYLIGSVQAYLRYWQDNHQAIDEERRERKERRGEEN